MDQRDEEFHRLRGCVRDLMALSALPLVWVGQEAPEVVASFLETLFASLRLELAYACVEDPRSGSAIEAAHADGQPEIPHRAREIGLALAPAVSLPHGVRETVTVPNPMRSGTLRLAAIPPTEAIVLILGESGTGKELIAREIHSRSPRADRPLVKVNCSTIPRDMFESEFFGHVRGAFTGALRDRRTIPTCGRWHYLPRRGRRSSIRSSAQTASRPPRGAIRAGRRTTRLSRSTCA